MLNVTVDEAIPKQFFVFIFFFTHMHTRHTHTHTCTHTHTLQVIHTHTPIATPQKMKPRLQKKTKAEKTIEKAMDSFMAYQRDADEQFQEHEERRQKDIELEEKRRHEDREHDIKMLQMLGSIFQGGSYKNYNPEQYDFDY